MKFPEFSVYGVAVKDGNEQHYVKKIADLLYPFLTEQAHKNDREELVRVELARIALRAVLDARDIGKGPLLP